MSDINAAPMAWPVANAMAEGTPAPEAVAQVALQEVLASGNVSAPLVTGADTTQAAPDSPDMTSADATKARESSITSSDSAASNSDTPQADLPRESHLLLLEHKLAMMHAKFKTGERIVVDEFEQIIGHIRAVL